MTDPVDSTAVVERLGDAHAAEVCKRPPTTPTATPRAVLSLSR